MPKPRSVSPTIYFKNRETLDRLKKLTEKVPNSSISGVINALLDASIEELEKKAPKARTFTIEIEIAL